MPARPRRPRRGRPQHPGERHGQRAHHQPADQRGARPVEEHARGPARTSRRSTGTARPRGPTAPSAGAAAWSSAPIMTTDTSSQPAVVRRAGRPGTSGQPGVGVRPRPVPGVDHLRVEEQVPRRQRRRRDPTRRDAAPGAPASGRRPGTPATAIIAQASGTTAGTPSTSWAEVTRVRVGADGTPVCTPTASAVSPPPPATASSTTAPRIPCTRAASLTDAAAQKTSTVAMVAALRAVSGTNG